MINSNISIKLAAFIVPNSAAEFVDYSQAFAPGPAGAPPATAPVARDPADFYPPAIAPRQFLLSEVPPESLLKMCEDFKAEIFKRAGKSSYLEG